MGVGVLVGVVVGMAIAIAVALAVGDAVPVGATGVDEFVMVGALWGVSVGGGLLLPPQAISATAQTSIVPHRRARAIVVTTSNYL